MKSIIDAVLNRLIGELFICVGKGSGSEGHHQGCQRTIMSHGNFLRILSLFLSTAAFVTGSLPRPLSSLAIVAQPIVASCCRRFCQHLSASTAVASVAGYLIEVYQPLISLLPSSGTIIILSVGMSSGVLPSLPLIFPSFFLFPPPLPPPPRPAQQTRNRKKRTSPTT